MKQYIALLLLQLLTMASFAQAVEQPQMADQFRADGKIYVVIAVVCIVLIGLFIYLLSLDRKISKLEKDLK